MNKDDFISRQTQSNEDVGRENEGDNSLHVGSNIFDSMKHCVAIGGIGTNPVGAAANAGGALRTFAAAAGICIPVPEKHK